MRIQHNTLAINAGRMVWVNQTGLSKNLEKLSSGYRINRAADDAAGLAVSEAMRNKIRGLEQGQQNEKDGIGFLEVGDGAMTEIHAMLQRMKTLSIESANGTLNDEARGMIDLEVRELKKEINRIGETTDYAGEKVFKNDPMLLLDGRLNDVEVFDDSYDATGNVTYGGFVIKGKRRYAWDSKALTFSVETDDGSGNKTYSVTGVTAGPGTYSMVRTDAGKQVFNG